MTVILTVILTVNTKVILILYDKYIYIPLKKKIIMKVNF